MAHPLALPLRRPCRQPGHGWRRLGACLPAACPLCGGAARGARLCRPCCRDVLASMRGGAARCRECRARLPSQAAGLCAACLRRRLRLGRCVTAFDYLMPGDWLIQRYKGGQLALAHALGALMAQAWRRERPMMAAWLVPVPASAQALRRRGFNPAAELAQVAGDWLGLPVARWGLRRRRARAPQTGRSRRARWRGLRGVFEADPALAGQAVLVVDDVLTTGATAQAAVWALRRAGARCVGVLAAARTPAPGWHNSA
ncbi:ComF family protein [Bordetella trematum]|uniref:ComF family protein n=1 Tax=Bordetella trematum TaxID=123899 RepID=UPI0004B9AEF1|nr:phosphoribosyltransferase family protein [Bordetella trematum]